VVTGTVRAAVAEVATILLRRAALAQTAQF
jgi:hypothetical protein